MADIQRLESDMERREQASDWIVSLNMGEMSADDRLRFEQWRRAHPRNQEAYNEVLGTWDKLHAMGKVVRAYDLSRALTESTQNAIRRSRAARDRTKRIMLASAAAVVAAASVGWWTTARPPNALFQTGVGEHATVKLTDGSSLELNSDSRALVDYTEKYRLIRLERGEAYFEVKHDVQRPFWVAAGKSWVGAVGTAFNVDLRKAETRVTVSEGLVKVSSAADAPPLAAGSEHVSMLFVRAGQQLSVEGRPSHARSLAPGEMDRSLSWRQGLVDFKDDRLADVIEELNRYTTLKIELNGEALRDLQVGGAFETSPQGVDSFLENLQEGLGLQVRREGHTVTISEQKPEN